MKIPKQARRTAKQLFKSCLREGQLQDDKVRETVRALIAAKPRDYLAVLVHFKRLVKLEVQRRTALIETVVPMAPEVAKAIQQALATRYGPGLRFVFAQRAELLGGLRVQVGSDVFDGTIRARLEALKAAFSACA